MGNERPRFKKDHGTPEYRSWQHMKSRCLNPRDTNFRLYGGRGITVCARWQTSFDAFLQDMGPRPDGTSINRIDNDGHYEPGNCRWATVIEQGRNKRARLPMERRINPVWLAWDHFDKGIPMPQKYRGLPRPPSPWLPEPLVGA